MGYIISILIALVFTSSSHGEECQLPDLPRGFRARVQMNSAQGFYTKQTHTYEQVVDEANQRSLIHSFREVAYDEGPNKVFEDWFIWNPTLDGIKDFLHIFKDQDDRFACQANNKASNDLYLFLLGYNSKDNSPTVVNTLRFGPKHGYKCLNDTVIQGVPVKAYTATWKKDTDPKTELEITYYWSDVSKWVGTAGLNASIPIKASIKGKFGHGGSQMKDVDVQLIFSSFESLRSNYNYNWMSRFPAISCQDREYQISLRDVDKYFLYNFEGHTVFQRKGKENVPITIRGKEYHDTEDFLLQREFHWISISNPAKTINFNVIKDFDEGLDYIMDIDSGKCYITPIYKTDDDAVVTPNGTIVMSDSTLLWDSSLKYSHNGIFKHRGVDSDVFVTLMEKNNTNSKTFAIYFSSINWTQANEFHYEYDVPIRTEEHLTSLYGDPKVSIVQNIENFHTNPTDMSSFDISFCLVDTQKRRKMIRFPWTKEMDLHKRENEISRNVRHAASRCAGIKGRRIQRVDFTLAVKSSLIYVFFDVLEMGIVNVGEDTRSNPPTNTLEMALENLKKCIDDSRFVLHLPSKEGTTHTIAETNFFIDVISEDSDAFQKHDFDKYSPGSMAGIGIGMLLVGIVLGVGTLIGLTRANRVPSVDRTPPFVHF